MIKAFISSAVKRSGILELLNNFCLVLAFILAFIAPWCFYCLIVTAIADIVRFIICGAWYYTDHHKASHKWCPQKDDVYKHGIYVKLALYVVLLAVVLLKATPTTHVGICFCIAFISIVETMRTVAHVLQKYDYTWLKRYQGKLVFLDKASIARFAVAVCLPCVPFLGKHGCIIAIVTITIFALCSEVLDIQYTDRRRVGVNKYYCWTDTAGRKLLFLGQSIVITILATKSIYMINGTLIAIPIGFCLLIANIKDVTTAYWHISGSCSFSDGQSPSSYFTNILRNWMFYVFFIVAYTTLLTGSLQGMKFCLVYSIALAAISIVSLFLDRESMKKAALYRGPY